MEYFSEEINLFDCTPSRQGVEKSERRDAVENRARILATAKTLFVENSVSCVSMAEIAAAAGVGKGTLYRRFANKGDLCLALLDSHLQTFQDDTLASLRTMRAQGKPYRQQLCLILCTIVDFTETHTALLQEAQNNEFTGDAEATSPHFVWQYLTIRGLLWSALHAGEVPSDLDVNWMADALLAPLHAQLYQFLREARGFSKKRIADGLEMLVENLPVP